MWLRERSRHSNGAKQVTLVREREERERAPKGLCKHTCVNLWSCLTDEARRVCWCEEARIG